MTTLDPLALATAATTAAAADGRPVLEHALELAGAARTLGTLLARLEDCKSFTATVEAVDLEQSSTRLLVSVRSRPGDDPEQLRTDRTDTAFGAVMAARTRALVGRRVLVHKALEDAGTDRKVRVLAWIEPLDGDGPATPATVPATDRATTAASSSTNGRQPPPPPPPDDDGGPAPAEVRDRHPAGAANRPTPADRVLAITDAAGVPRDHVDALVRTRYGAPALADLDPAHAASLADRLADPDQLTRFRRSAAEDRAAELTTGGHP